MNTYKSYSKLLIEEVMLIESTGGKEANTPFIPKGCKAQNTVGL